MLREGLVEEFSEENAPAMPGGAPDSGHQVVDGTTPGEFATRGIRETNL